MTYFEQRPVLIDVDADVEIEADVRDHEEMGLVVRLRIRPIGGGQKIAEVDVPQQAWQDFVQAVRGRIKVESKR
jgi:hypothetical protein